MCPHCGRDAPIVYRGALPQCAACGKPRTPLAGPAVHLTGKPSKVGGQVARVIGWITLVFGASVALLVGWLFQVLFPAGVVGIVLGIALLAVTLVLSGALLFGGRALRDSGEKAEARTFEKAVFALAEARGGILSSLDVAQMLGLADAEADRLLTELAKTSPDRVRVEIDDSGSIVYQFPHAMIGTAKTEFAMQALDEAAVEEAASQVGGVPPTRRSVR